MNRRSLLLVLALTIGLVTIIVSLVLLATNDPDMYDELSNPLWASIITAIITTSGTAYFTYMITTKHVKDSENKKKQEQTNFNIRVVQLISAEIQYYLEILEKSLRPSSNPPPQDPNSDQLLIDRTQLERIIFKMHGLLRSYSELPSETRVRVFQPDDLEILELGYRNFSQLLSDLQYKISEGKLAGGNNVLFSKTDLDECIKNLNSALETIAAMCD